MVFYNFLLHLMRSFDYKQKKSSYFEKKFSLIVKMMTSRFGKWVGSKFCHPQFSSILVPKNLIETKKLLLASIGKQDFFFNIRTCTKSENKINNINSQLERLRLNGIQWPWIQIPLKSTFYRCFKQSFSGEYHIYIIYVYVYIYIYIYIY